jgi:chorismate mutase
MFDNESLLPFQNGRAVGLKKGVGIGRQQGHERGYVDGWNAAIDECNPTIDSLKTQCIAFRDERDQLARQLSELQQQHAATNANSERAIKEAREIRIAFNLLQTVAVSFLQQLIAANAVTRKSIKAIILSLTENKKETGEPLPWESSKFKQELPRLSQVLKNWHHEAAKDISTEHEKSK